MLKMYRDSVILYKLKKQSLFIVPHAYMCFSLMIAYVRTSFDH